MATLIRERSVEAYLRAQARKRGWLPYKFTSPGRSGVPDQLIVTDWGETVFVEVKRPGGKLSRLQEHHITALKGQGAQAWVVYCKSDVDSLMLTIEDRP